MKVKVQKIGGSHGVVIPARMLLQLGIKPGDSVEIAARRSKLFVAAASPHPRAGWAAASMRLVRAQRRRKQKRRPKIKDKKQSERFEKPLGKSARIKAVMHSTKS